MLYKKQSTVVTIIAAVIVLLSGCSSIDKITNTLHSQSADTISKTENSSKGLSHEGNANTVANVTDSTQAKMQNSSHAVTPNSPLKPSAKPVPTSALINVAPVNQHPQLPNGCEVTSLSMLLSYLGHPVDKVQLAKEEPVDTTKRIYKPDGTTTFWGNPNIGFVGSPFQADNGYGIYHKPLATLLNKVLPGQAEDLTHQPFTEILKKVSAGLPVVVWDTATFKPTNSWTSWNTPEGPIKVTLQEHAVLLVGYDSTQLFVNNPLNGQKAEPVNRADFISAWKQLGEQALTVKG